MALHLGRIDEGDAPVVHTCALGSLRINEAASAATDLASPGLRRGSLLRPVRRATVNRKGKRKTNSFRWLMD
jgi:hypothetical protein